MKIRALFLVLAAVMAGSFSVSGAKIEDEAKPATTPEAAPAASVVTAAPATPDSATPPGKLYISPCAAEVIKMSKSGVDASIIKSYIEGSSDAYYPAAPEIIYLHNQGVPGDLISALIKRGSVLRAEAIQWAKQAQAQVAAAQAQAVPTVVTQAVPTVITQPAPVYVYQTPAYVPYPQYSYGYYSRPFYFGFYNTCYYPSLSRRYSPVNHFGIGFHANFGPRFGYGRHAGPVRYGGGIYHRR